MDEVKKASVSTKLKLGAVEVDVSLFKATGKPEAARKYEAAGPHGGPLRAVAEAGEATPAETEGGDDPFGVREDRPATVPGRYRRALVEEGTGEEVPPEAVRRGVRREDGSFVDLTDHLDRIEELSRLDRLEVIGFLDRRAVPRERVVGAYFLGAEEAFAPRVLRVLAEAMRATDRVAVVVWTKRKGRSLGVLAPGRSGALTVLELVWPGQARRPNARCLAHLRAEVTEGEVERAAELIRAMSARREDLDDLRDPRLAAEAELLARAEAGELEEFRLEPERPEEMAGLEALLSDSLTAA